MKCLVTGAGGFIGGHLVRNLMANGQDVCAADTAPGSFLQTLQGSVRIRDLDVTAKPAIEKMLAEEKPDCIFHLAAQSYPSQSWNDPVATFQVNVLGTVHLMEAVRTSGCKPVVVLVGSSAEYVMSTDDRLIHEDIPLQPSTPYGVSKLAEDYLGMLYGRQYDLPVIRVRPFFVVGPGKRGDVCSDFAQGIVAIERGRADRLAVGNLSIVRDLLDVRDGVEALRVMAERGKPGAVYNLCSGTGYALREILDIYKGLAKVPVTEWEDPSKIRPIDEPVRIGDPTRLKKLGWAPAIPIETTLSDILNHWRNQMESV